MDDTSARCGSATVRAEDGRLVVPGGRPTSTDDWVAGTWAAAHLAWQAQDAGRPLDVTEAVATLVRPVATPTA